MKSITLLDPTHMMSVAYLVTIGLETPMIDSGHFLEKEFIELNRMNP